MYKKNNDIETMKVKSNYLLSLKVLTCLAVSAIKSSSFATTFKSGLRRYLGTRAFIQARFFSRAYVATSSCNETVKVLKKYVKYIVNVLLFYRFNRSSKTKYRLSLPFSANLQSSLLSYLYSDLQP